LYSSLISDFKEYQEQQKLKPHEELSVEALTGVEFEVYIAKRMQAAGFDVATPTTGDQGADLIAKKEGRKYIIQAKRYQGTVGNKAVQEVISALSFYGGDEGWVVANSTDIPRAHLRGREQPRNRTDYIALDGALQVARSISLVRALLQQELPCFDRHPGEGQLAFIRDAELCSSNAQMPFIMSNSRHLMMAEARG
jgi:Restriction endonuclease